MEFKVLEKDEGRLVIKVLDADASVMYPIIEQLIEDERVEDANYSVEHQELDDPVLTIQAVEGEEPKEILTDIAKSIKGQFNEIYSELFGEEE
ncbi:MAG: RpoL/Rpb11 RNA polymerase subunit family protein [Candidatus Saliniplasma sp.]